MKSLKYVFAVVLLFVSFQFLKAQIVTERPKIPKYKPTKCPDKQYEWIKEDWEYKDGKYVFTGGKWVNPPHPYMMWVPGFWKKKGGGEVWVKGYWRIMN